MLGDLEIDGDTTEKFLALPLLRQCKLDTQPHSVRVCARAVHWTWH